MHVQEPEFELLSVAFEAKASAGPGTLQGTPTINCSKARDSVGVEYNV